MELALLFKVEFWRVNFLAVAGESTKSAKIFAKQNFTLYGIINAFFKTPY